MASRPLAAIGIWLSKNVPTTNTTTAIQESPSNWPIYSEILDAMKQGDGGFRHANRAK